MKAIARCSEFVDVPEAFIASISKEELQTLMFSKSLMNEDQKRRLWKLLGRKDSVPTEIQLLVTPDALISSSTTQCR